MRNSSKVDETADSDEAAGEAKAAFHLRMRARGVRDLAVLRAFELVPRDVFVPDRYHALAARDLPVPIACGQTMPEPWLVARMIEALAVGPTHRVLEIGAGTGYTTAILATLAEEVIGFERYQTLARAAQARLSALAIENAAIVWADGLALTGKVAFDRIIVHGRLDVPPAALADRLEVDGLLVCARTVSGTPSIVRLAKDGAGGWIETVICDGRLQPMIAGAAVTL